MRRFDYTREIDFGLKNLHQGTKKRLPEVVTTFLVLFSVGDQKINNF